MSDSNQLEKVKRHAQDVKGLRDNLRYWNYEEVLKIHSNLAYVSECINDLRLVPVGF